ncbi:hypothetical protein ACI79P_13145 [Blastococcus sp. SYSU DS0510]
MTIDCPQCGETEDLVGSRSAEGIRIACGSCGTSFLRDQRLRCATCGGSDLVRRPQVLTQFSRGTQLSVVGWKDTTCCATCDADALLRSERANGPIPADYVPRAGTAQPST